MHIEKLSDNLLYKHPFSFLELVKNDPIEALNFEKFLLLQEKMKLKNQFFMSFIIYNLNAHIADKNSKRIRYL